MNLNQDGDAGDGSGNQGGDAGYGGQGGDGPYGGGQAGSGGYGGDQGGYGGDGGYGGQDGGAGYGGGDSGAPLRGLPLPRLALVPSDVTNLFAALVTSTGPLRDFNWSSSGLPSAVHRPHVPSNTAPCRETCAAGSPRSCSSKLQ